MWKCKSFFIILGFVYLVIAQQVELSGVAKMKDGTPLEGVKISLTKIDSLSTFTKQDGSFSLKTPKNSVISIKPNTLSWELLLQGNTILFTSTNLNNSVSVRIYNN